MILGSKGRVPELLMYRGHTIRFHRETTDRGLEWRIEVLSRGKWVGGVTYGGTEPILAAMAIVDRLAYRRVA